MKKNNRREFLKKSITTGTGAALGVISFCSGCCSCEQRPEKTAKKEVDYSRIAYCGIYCDTCPLYKATIANDDEAKMAVAKEWGESTKPDFKPEEYYCYGCKDKRSRGTVGYHCTVKQCAMKKGYSLCSQCNELETCDEQLWKELPWLREKSIKLRKELGIRLDT